MSFFKKEAPPQLPPDLLDNLESVKPPLVKPELDPESKEFNDRAIWEKRDLGQKIQKLQIARETLMRLVVSKDSDGRDSEITIDSKLSDIVKYIDEELDAALKEREIL